MHSITDFGTKNTSTDFAIILFDIDNFKRINHHRGHDVGDIVLRDVAKIIARNLRISDCVARWGGEEFVIILPYTRFEFALALAEKIRISVSTYNFDARQPLHATLGAGVSAIMSGESFADAFKRTDEALYKAKNSGRNACVLARPHSFEHLNFPQL